MLPEEEAVLTKAASFVFAPGSCSPAFTIFALPEGRNECTNHEKGTYYHLLLASGRGRRGATMAETLQIPSGFRLDAGDLYPRRG